MNTATTDVCTLQGWQHQPDIPNIGKGLPEKFALLWTKSVWLKNQEVSKQSRTKEILVSTVLEKEIRLENWF